MRFKSLPQITEAIKSAVSIADYLETQMDVECASHGSFKICCPFHQEKTPSFHVSLDKGRFKCFGAGCEVSGDVIDLASLNEGTDFMGSVKKLAQMGSVDLSPFIAAQTEEEKKLATFYIINKKAAEFFQQSLRSSIMAMGYLTEEREHTPEIVEQFQLGYSRNPIDLIKHLGSSVNISVLHDLELDRNDIFVDSIIYPVYSPSGVIVSFHARPFSGKPKYIGTSAKSPTFVGSERIYGFHIAKKHIRINNGVLVMVEGQHDVITLHQHGIQNVVAVMGGDMTEEQLTVLKEHKVRTIIFCPDGDVSESKLIGISQRLRSPILIKIALIPDASDPDDFVKQRGAPAFREVLSKAVVLPEYAINRAAAKYDLSVVSNKFEFLRDIAPYIQSLSGVERTIVYKSMASKLGASIEDIEDYIAINQRQTGEVKLFAFEAEQAVIAELISNYEFSLSHILELKAEDFYSKKHQVIFEVLLGLSRKVQTTLGPSVVYAELEKISKHEELGGYVYELVEKARSESVAFLLQEVIDRAKRREAQKRTQLFNAAIVDMKKSPDESVEEHLRGVSEIMVRGSRGSVVSSKEAVRDTMKVIHQRMNEGNEIIGIHPGPDFPRIAKITRGFQKHRIYVVSAPTGVGKTNLSMDLVLNACVEEKIPVGWFSLEMDQTSMTMRFLSKMSGVPFTNIETGILDKEQNAKVRDSAFTLMQSPLHMFCHPMTVDQVVSIARSLKHKHGIEILVLDYIQMVKVPQMGKNASGYDEKGLISKMIMNEIVNAGDVGIPVIIVAQDNREGAKEKGIITGAHIADSYQIVQDAAVHVTYQYKIGAKGEFMNAKGIGNRLLYVDKNRFGRRDVIIPIFFDDNEVSGDLTAKEIDPSAQPVFTSDQN